MIIKQAVIIAAAGAIASLGLACPAYAQTPGHTVPSVTEKQCKQGGGKVKRDESTIQLSLSGKYCHGGKDDGDEID